MRYLLLYNIRFVLTYFHTCGDDEDMLKVIHHIGLLCNHSIDDITYVHDDIKKMLCERDLHSSNNVWNDATSPPYPLGESWFHPGLKPLSFFFDATQTPKLKPRFRNLILNVKNKKHKWTKFCSISECTFAQIGSFLLTYRNAMFGILCNVMKISIGESTHTPEEMMNLLLGIFIFFNLFATFNFVFVMCKQKKTQMNHFQL